MDIRISSITARPILDSIGNWTIEATITLSDGTSAQASVPCGKRNGAREVVSLPAHEAVQAVNILIDETFSGLPLLNQELFEEKLQEVDSTRNKSYLGGNTTLAVSLAYARVMARVHGVFLWQYLHALYNASSRLVFPRIWAMAISGELYEGKGIGIQEYLISPKTRDIVKSQRLVQSFYKLLEDILEEKYGKSATLIGSGGGFAPLMKDIEEPMKLLQQVLDTEDFAHTLELGISVGRYPQTQKAIDDRHKMYNKFKNRYDIAYLEDPFKEDEIAEFKKLRDRLHGCSIVGNDLTVTDERLIDRAVSHEAIDAVLINPYQRGTLTEVFEAIHTSKKNGLEIIISSRSGETNDSFISDLAIAVNARGIKLGALRGGERVAKYNRLLEIHRELEECK